MHFKIVLIDFFHENFIYLAIRTGNEQAVRSLLAYGATLDCQNFTGTTPLQEACDHQQTAIVELLKAHQAISKSTPVSTSGFWKQSSPSPTQELDVSQKPILK